MLPGPGTLRGDLMQDTRLSHGAFPGHAGNCATEIQKYCPTVESGLGKIADCISDQITESEMNTDGERPHACLCILRGWKPSERSF